MGGKVKSRPETEDARETRRVRETTPAGPALPQTPTSDGEGESGTGDYGVALGAGGHRGFGPSTDPKPQRRRLRSRKRDA